MLVSIKYSRTMYFQSYAKSVTGKKKNVNFHDEASIASPPKVERYGVRGVKSQAKPTHEYSHTKH